MRRLAKVWTKAIAGNVAVAVLLAGGMTLIIRRLDSLATVQVASIRAKEAETTLVERLRWNGELIVSDGRGYVISRDAELLANLNKAALEFDQNVRALRGQPLSSKGAEIVTEIEQAARKFRSVQEDLLAVRRRSEDTPRILRRFESELLPLRREFGQALDRLVTHKEASLRDVYDQARKDRNRVAASMYALLAILLATGLAITAYFARLLARSYVTTEKALDSERKALAARDELMRVVAHDLRSPLGVITTKAAALRTQADPEQTRSQAESIHTVAMRMEHLIRTMLDVATIEAGRFSVSPTVCTVEDLLRQASEIMASRASAKRIRLKQMPGDAALVIYADHGRVLQVLSNLLSNAIEFSPEGTEVGISTERQGDVVCFAISDFGPGIDPAHLPHLFDRLWKDETAGKKGSGLGLFIAKSIVDAHGGHIWVENDLGRGTTFYFTIPVAESERAASS